MLFAIVDGVMTYVSSVDLAQDVNRWLTRGLSELVRDEAGLLRPRHTGPSDPEFVGRLTAYVEHYGFQVVRD